MKFLYTYGQRDLLVEEAFNKYKKLFNTEVLEPAFSVDTGRYKCFGKRDHTSVNEIQSVSLTIGHYPYDWYLRFRFTDNEMSIENDANNLFGYYFMYNESSCIVSNSLFFLEYASNYTNIKYAPIESSYYNDIMTYSKGVIKHIEQCSNINEEVINPSTFNKYLKASLTQIYDDVIQEDKRYLQTISGGMDTRLLLNIDKEKDVDIDCVTWYSPNNPCLDNKDGDLYLAKKIVKKFNKKHILHKLSGAEDKIDEFLYNYCLLSDFCGNTFEGYLDNFSLYTDVCPKYEAMIRGDNIFPTAYDGYEEEASFDFLINKFQLTNTSNSLVKLYFTDCFYPLCSRDIYYIVKYMSKNYKDSLLNRKAYIEFMTSEYRNNGLRYTDQDNYYSNCFRNTGTEDILIKLANTNLFSVYKERHNRDRKLLKFISNKMKAAILDNII